MFEVTKNFSWRVREKRARQRLQMKQAAKKIGVSRQTLYRIESNEGIKIKKTVYQKIVNWLLEDD